MAKSANNEIIDKRDSTADNPVSKTYPNKDIQLNKMEENKNDVKEDFKDEVVPVEPVLDNDGNEIGGEG